MADSSECSLQNRSKLASTSTPLRTISLNNASSSTSKRDLIPPLVESECLHNITAIIPPEESFIEQSLSAFGTSDVYQNPITFPDYNITNDEISYSPHNFEDGAMRAIKQALIDSDNHVMSTSEEEIKDYILKRKSKRQFWLTQTMSDEFSIVPRIDNLYLLDHLEKYQKLVIEFTLKNSRSDTAEVRTEVKNHQTVLKLPNDKQSFSSRYDQTKNTLEMSSTTRVLPPRSNTKQLNGIQKVGNSCFFNVVIQLLAATTNSCLSHFNRRCHLE
ncbi:unnamed protein product, partial [Didymodactylos carnosus]